MSKVDCRRRARSKATYSMTPTGHLHSFKCRLKLENGPLRLEGSKSLPSFEDGKEGGLDHVSRKIKRSFHNSLKTMT